MKKVLTSCVVLFATIAIYSANMSCFAVWHQPQTPKFIA